MTPRYTKCRNTVACAIYNMDRNKIMDSLEIRIITSVFFGQISDVTNFKQCIQRGTKPFPVYLSQHRFDAPHALTSGIKNH